MATMMMARMMIKQPNILLLYLVVSDAYRLSFVVSPDCSLRLLNLRFFGLLVSASWRLRFGDDGADYSDDHEGDRVLSGRMAGVGVDIRHNYLSHHI